ncbi:MAG: hypothetical protein RBU36_15890 [Thermoanaerobaculia bacterium]|jgi:hypothetical protein|nr:hypothetical protein [Thermoanaerobaculia bacterium]
MARPRKNGSSGSLDGSVTADYRHAGVKRKNVPPATMAAEGTVPKVAKARYAYSPHLPPVLRFDGTGKADALPELLAEAGRRALKPEELKKGFDVNDPAQKYSLRSLPGEYSGLHLVCILDVGMKLVDPTADTGFDLSKEYEEAKALFGAAGDGLP